MKLKFITGLSGSGKTTYIANEIISKSIKNPEKNIICIVPEQFTLQTERNLIQISKSKTLLKIQILSFKRLAYRIFSELGQSEKPLLNDISKSVLLRKILNESTNEMQFFNKSICGRNGFVEKMNKTISEFFQYCVTEEKLNYIVKKTEEEDKNSDIALKLKDISLIYSKYLNYLEESYVSTDETLDYLSQKLINSKFLKDAVFYIDGFNGFTPQEFKVIEQLFKVAESINIALTINSSSTELLKSDIFDPYFDSKKTIKKLKAMANDNKAVIEKSVHLKENMRHKSNIELAFLENNYFAYPSKKYKYKPSFISVYAALNKYSEIKKAADYITYLVKKNNYRYSDIAIITPGEDYINYLINILNKYDIPYFTDAKKCIKTHSLTELICSVLDIVSYNYSYESVFSYIKTGFLSECEKFEVSKDDLDILENYVLSQGIKGYKWKKDNWIYGFQKSSYFDAETINNTKSEVLKSLLPISLDNTKIYKVKEIALSLIHFLINLEVPKTLKKWSEISEDEDKNLLIKRENIQVWKNIMEIIDDTVKILGESEMTVLEYSNILNSAFENTKTGYIPSSQDQVLIGDFGRTRLPDIKALIILNINDGVLPALKEDSGFISDIEREYITKNGVELAPNLKRLVSQDDFIAYTTLTKPIERLYLSYSISDLDGKETKPSLIINKITEIFPMLKIEYETIEKQITLDDITSPEPVFEDLIKSIQKYKSGAEVSPFYKDAYFYFDKFYNSKINSLKLGLFKVNPIDKLNKKSINKLYSKKIINSSVTRLETFKQCPFSYFVKYGLNAYPRENYKIGSLEIGNIYHSIMENFSNFISKNKIDWHKITADEINNYIDDAVDKSISNQNTDIFSSNAKYTHYIDKIKRTTKISALALINNIKQGSFNPYGFEFAFKVPQKDENNNPVEDGKFFLKPIQIHLQNGYKIILDGKIDRIDIMDKDGKIYVNILDYKSSEKTLELQQIFAGVQLQLLLYLDAFIKIKSNDDEFKEKIMIPGGAFYFKIFDPIFNGSFKTNQEDNIITENDFQKKFLHTGFINNKKEMLIGLNNEVAKKDFDEIKPSDFNYIKPTFFSEENLKYIMQYVTVAAADSANEMIKGNIGIYPLIYNNNSSCDYCNYNTICALDIIDKKTYGNNSKFNICKKINNSECMAEILKRLGLD